jgi:serine/threonine-protein kinase
MASCGHAVAIKVLHERRAGNPQIERLFRREAQLVNQVKHPGVVPVIDDDVTEDGCIFLVMPLLEGENVRARTVRLGGSLPMREVLAIAHGVLGVLEAAHAKKIVHRDVKPDNVFVTVDGDVRVLDFGIGRFFETNDPGSMTQSGVAFGTPAFMAPEQALGRTREVDGRTDVFAVGAMMFYLATGELVHPAENASELLAYAATRRARSLGSVRGLDGEIPPAIVEVVDRALAQEKGARWGSAAEMRGALWGAYAATFGVDGSGIDGIRLEVPADAAAGDDGPAYRPTERVAPSRRFGEGTKPVIERRGSPTLTLTNAVRTARLAVQGARWPRLTVAGAALSVVVAATTAATLRAAEPRAATGEGARSAARDGVTADVAVAERFLPVTSSSPIVPDLQEVAPPKVAAVERGRTSSRTPPAPNATAPIAAKKGLHMKDIRPLD